MRIYEELFILKPDVTDEEVDGLTSQLEGVITSAGGKIEKIDKWGVRKLAYKVDKKSDGYFVLIGFHSKPDTVREVERRLRVADVVMKHLTVRMDEKLKWLEKRQKARAARAARKPAPSAPPPGAPIAPGVPPPPAAPMPGAPGATAPVVEAAPVEAGS
jgi:small subunit ribosomal protein S6